MQVILGIIEACDISCEGFFYEDIEAYKIDKEILNLIKKVDTKKEIAVKTLLVELLK